MLKYAISKEKVKLFVFKMCVSIHEEESIQHIYKHFMLKIVQAVPPPKKKMKEI